MDGVWFVDLARLFDRALVPQAVGLTGEIARKLSGLLVPQPVKHW